MRPGRRLLALCAALVLVACGAREEATMDDATEPEAIVLGPADGHDLPPVDLERVQVGDPAPDFTLTSLAGPPVTLSDYRGEKAVVLVFYRGHW